MRLYALWTNDGERASIFAHGDKKRALAEREGAEERGKTLKAIYTSPIDWLGDRVRILDQSRLPGEEVYLELEDYRDVASAIIELKIRGAPAIGIVGAYGIALGALKIESVIGDEFRKKLDAVMATIAATRPTARNLFWAIQRMQKVAESKNNDVSKIKSALLNEAVKIHAEEVEATRKISQLGAELIRDGDTVLVHCNAGPLATAGYGTALGVILFAREQGKKVRVIATETRPVLQGARITTWELKKAGVPVTLIADSMAGYFMKRGEINCVIVGADRIAANGDTANKIGTYTLAVLAKENNVPFYVAAPTSTIDHALASGKQVPIEQRKPEEITHIRGVRIAPEGIAVLNPAFDVTPHRYITAIITEKGIIREPYELNLKRAIGGSICS
ncbi:MAG: S-methyl-5-thioribose-1-phosphate isomerase [Dehalococcoidia bacterium]|nr:S-methyl-5-thioribose-1-phosphate isomerase [Dehalococcoidia bacterium]